MGVAFLQNMRKKSAACFYKKKLTEKYTNDFYPKNETARLII